MRPRTSVPLATIVVIAAVVVALVTLGGHGRRRPSVRVAPARSPEAICASEPEPAAARRGAAATHVRESALDRALDAALRVARARNRIPAATAAVVVCGRVEWAGASGVVDLGTRRPATDDTLFILNSAAKTVVATMVMREVQDGRLSLATRLSRFYPWLPNARRISIRMLLDMTSGLPDYLRNPRIQWMIHHRPRHRWTVHQVLTGLGAGLGDPLFPPGRKYDYSDTNYIVLGAIVTRITHRSIERDFQQLIARPSGMTSATWVPTPGAVARMAHPYVPRDGSLSSEWIPSFGVSTGVWGPVFTDGGLASSSVDFARFGNALLGDRLVSAAAVRQMTHIGRGNYGLGIRGRVFDGHFWLGHRGYFGGFEAEGWSDPSRQVTIAAATNLENVGREPDVTRVWSAITRAYDRRSE